MIKLGATELRTTKVDPEEAARIKRNPIYIVCDNVLDTYNVGSIFRLADAVSATQILLCGQTESPPNTRIKKASINTTEWVPWEYFKDAKSAVQSLKCKVQNQSLKLKVVCVEQDARSVPFYKAEYDFPIALVVGNETYGVSKEVLDMADQIVELPMWGVNKSLNVMVSLGIVLYEVMKKTEK